MGFIAKSPEESAERRANLKSKLSSIRLRLKGFNNTEEEQLFEQEKTKVFKVNRKKYLIQKARDEGKKEAKTQGLGGKLHRFGKGMANVSKGLVNEVREVGEALPRSPLENPAFNKGFTMPALQQGRKGKKQKSVMDMSFY